MRLQASKLSNARSLSILFSALVASTFVSVVFDRSIEAQQRRPQQATEGDDDSGGESPTARVKTSEEAKASVGEEKFVSVVYNIMLKTSGPDFAAIEKTAEGQVVPITMAVPPKLKTDLDLAFGETVIKTENISKSYPGVYSLWLKKTASGWSLVFNERADVWGTMHDAGADAAEVPLTHETAAQPTDALKMAIEGDGAAKTLRITWGTHAWSAGFSAQG